MKGRILTIVILPFFPDKVSLNLDLMRKKNLLNLLKRDLRFDIVSALNFDHYPDLIPISIGKKYPE
jgi:hypothetical protein